MNNNCPLPPSATTPAISVVTLLTWDVFSLKNYEITVTLSLLSKVAKWNGEGIEIIDIRNLPYFASALCLLCFQHYIIIITSFSGLYF